MFGQKSSHYDNLSGHTTTASEELVICSSIVLVATSAQFAVGRIALVFILVNSLSIIKQKFYNCNIRNILNHFCF